MWLAGCGAENPSKSEDTETRDQAVVYGNGNLAEGVDQSSTPSTATGHRCIAMEAQVEDVSKWNSAAFYTRSRADVERELDFTIQGDIPLKGAASGGFDLRPSFYKEGEEVTEKFVIVARVQTVDREAKRVPKGTGEEGGSDSAHMVNRCRAPDEQMELEEFVHDCGTSYIRRESLGGYVVMTASTENFSKEKRRAFEGNLNLEVVGKGVGTLAADMQWIKGSQWSSTTFQIDSYGISPPDSSLLNGNGEITAADTLNYINDIKNSYQNALNDGETHASEYGNVIEQHLQRYSYQDYQDCGIEEFRKAMACYNEFHMKDNRLEEDRDGIIAWKREAEWKLNHPGRVRWPEVGRNSKDVSTKYQEAVNHVDQCLNQDIPNRKSTCRNLYENHGYDELCDECTFPDGCSPGEIEARIAGLPDAPVRPPGPPGYNQPRKFTVGHNESMRMGEVESDGEYGNDLCLLNEVKGAFDGGGEEVRLRTDSGKWKLKTTSGKSKDSRKISAGAHCLKNDLFYNDNDATPGWTVDEYDIELTSDGNGTVPMSDGKYAASLRGISGSLAGGGEFGLTESSKMGETPSLRAKTAQGYIRAFGMSWGLDNPGSEKSTGKGVMIHTRGSGEKQLSRIDESMCFLTRVNGEFDGKGEWARVEMRENHWFLNVRAACDKSGLGSGCNERKLVKASARCYDLVQEDGN